MNTRKTTAMSDYIQFLEKKKAPIQVKGFDATWIPDTLYPFQAEAVKIACHRGRNAMFEDCGMGKTLQQLVWAENVRQHTNKPILIVAPLAVAKQTANESTEKLGMDVSIVRQQSDCGSGLNICNYEMLHHFDPTQFGGLVLDESGILKGYEGKFRQFVTDFAKQIDYRLPCTATPAPNDLVELINHAEFLSILRGKEAIAMFFTQDGNTTHSWRLKGHARTPFWRWVAGWAVALQKPSDLGFDDDGFNLPELRVHQHTVGGHITQDYLIPLQAHTMDERRQARKESINDRVARVAEIANSTNESVLVWCDLNAESDALRKAIPDAVEVRGSDSVETKISRLTGFSDGVHRVLVTKPSIAGWGMNWQHCGIQCFTGLSDSFEQFYQAVRRCWRYGRTLPVDVHIVCAETEGAVVENINRKERESHEMMRQIVAHMRDVWINDAKRNIYSDSQQIEIPSWIRG